MQKYLKPVLQKLGALQFPSPNGLGFQVQILITTNLKVWKKKFSYPCLGFFHQNHCNVLLKQFHFRKNLLMQMRENTDLPWQKPQQLPSAEANFKGWRVD